MKRRSRFLPVLPAVLSVVLLCTWAVAADPPSPAPVTPVGSGATDPLIQVLVSKGILSGSEAQQAASGTVAEQREHLIQLLRQKGVLSDDEAGRLQPVAAVAPASASPDMNATYQPAVLTSVISDGQGSSAPKTTPVIPAVAPIRVLQLEPASPGGLIPDLKLGSGAKLKFYGFFKTSVVYDTMSQQGNDFPLPGFLGDTGPHGSPEFHLKGRASRFGSNFEWPDISSSTALTARVELDFEGNFSRANNRNISSVRSNMPSLRLAWARLDHKATDKTSVFALFGQDWTPFGSSTLPNLLETTGLAIGFGNLYQRAPQVRVGVVHDFGGFKIDPEFAVVFPGWGDLPPTLGVQTVTVPSGLTGSQIIAVATGSGSIGDQLGYGERQGADSQRPEIEGRLVTQWQLDHAKGVAPAQFIISGMEASRSVVVPKGNIPCLDPTVSAAKCSSTAGSSGLPENALFKAFPNGAQIDTNRWGVSGELQLPTRWVTLTSKYYNGTGLRWFFAGQIYSEFTDLGGLSGTLAVPTGATFNTQFTGCPKGFNCAPSIDGSTIVVFGKNAAGQVVAAPQQEPRSQGGFVSLGFPLSRIFNAEPTGRNAGWTFNAYYGYDQVLARDVRRLAPTGGRDRSDLLAGNLQYKFNQYLTFGYELSDYRTRAPMGEHPLYRGVPAAVVHDLRSEFATIFTF